MVKTQNETYADHSKKCPYCGAVDNKTKEQPVPGVGRCELGKILVRRAAEELKFRWPRESRYQWIEMP
jgi:hypothetical protein